jgi:Caspase domain
MKSSAIEVSALLDRLKEQQPQVVLAIIDACRDNPFSKRGGRGVGSGAGLGASDPPKGMLQMMSAGKGETALDALSDDDPHPNSVYTRLLIPLLKQPGLEITEVALRIRSEVTELARTVGHDQSPAFYHELSGKFYLTEPRAAPAIADARASSVTSDAAPAWAAVAETRSVAVLESFAKRYGDTIYGDLARTRISEINGGSATSTALSAAPAMKPSAATAALASPATHPASSVFQAAQAWAATKDSNDTAALQAFASQYGDTIYGPMAQARIDQLKRTVLASSATTEAVRSTAQAASPTGQPAAPSTLEAGQAWNNTKNTDNPVVLERFIKQYGETIFGPPAQARLAELRGKPAAAPQPSQAVVAAAAPGASDAALAWANTKDTTNPTVVEHFLKQYGDSIYADQARAKLKQLKQEP